MLTEAWLSRGVEWLWGEGCPAPAFPRAIDSEARWAFPITIVPLQRLRPRAIEAWLAERRVSHRLICTDRRLHGCLLTCAGQGLVFLDADDEAAERHFTLAHELAHFWLDYLCVREDAVRVHGATILEVLDGHRAPSILERLDALLAGHSLGICVDLMHRRRDGAIVHSTALASEERADRLALEWLAPRAAVAAALAELRPAGTQQIQLTATTELLVTRFGLPHRIAADMAVRWLARRSGDRSRSPWLVR